MMACNFFFSFFIHRRQIPFSGTRNNVQNVVIYCCGEELHRGGISGKNTGKSGGLVPAEPHLTWLGSGFSHLHLAMLGSVDFPVGPFWLAWTARSEISWVSPAVAFIPFAWGNLCVFISTLQCTVDTYTGVAWSSRSP